MFHNNIATHGAFKVRNSNVNTILFPNQNQKAQRSLQGLDVKSKHSSLTLLEIDNLLRKIRLADLDNNPF